MREKMQWNQAEMDEWLEQNINEHTVRLYLIPGVPENTKFQTITRCEIKDIRWFEADPTFVLHWTNAYEDGDEVVLDGFFQHNPTARGVDRSVYVDLKHKGFETLDMNVLQARHHRRVHRNAISVVHCGRADHRALARSFV